MFQPAWLLMSALFLSFVPAQAKHSADAVASAKRAAPAFGVTAGGEACDHLSREECCGQMLEIAGFSAHGDQLPRRVKSMVRLTCEGRSNAVTPHACKSILMTRGFAPKEVHAACRPASARSECRKDGSCKQCTSDLAKLSYTGAHNACYAITYVPKVQERVVRVGRRAPGDSDTQFTITKRRRLR